MLIHLLKPHDIHPAHWYGVSRYATEMVRAMRHVDPSVEFVSFHFSLRGRVPPERQRLLEQAGVNLRNARLPDLSRFTRYHQLTERWVLPRLVERAGCEISWGTNCVALRKGRHPFRTAVTIHDLFLITHPELSDTQFTALVAPRLKQTAEEADVILTDSEFTRRQIVELLGIDMGKVVVTHLGAIPALQDPGSGENTAETQPGPSSPPHASGRKPPLEVAGWPLDEPPILSVGTVEPRKNYARGLEVYRLLQRQRDHVPPWVIVGRNGWKYEGFYAARAKLGLEERVRVLHPISDDLLHRMYRSARCLFCPSIVEGFGLPVLEAMQAGLPVVCSTGGALPEVGGDAVLSADPNDTQALATALARLFSDRALADDLAQRAQRRALQFGWEHAARRALEAFRRVTCGA